MVRLLTLLIRVIVTLYRLVVLEYPWPNQSADMPSAPFIPAYKKAMIIAVASNCINSVFAIASSSADEINLLTRNNITNTDRTNINTTATAVSQLENSCSIPVLDGNDNPISMIKMNIDMYPLWYEHIHFSSLLSIISIFSILLSIQSPYHCNNFDKPGISISPPIALDIPLMNEIVNMIFRIGKI